jgi:hypothetical protein
VFYTTEGLEGSIGIPLGAFADPTFPSPTFSVYEERMHSCVFMPPASSTWRRQTATTNMSVNRTLHGLVTSTLGATRQSHSASVGSHRLGSGNGIAWASRRSGVLVEVKQWRLTRRGQAYGQQKHRDHD